MKNKDLYKTAEERIYKFREYCGSHTCSDCPVYSRYSRECAFLWLELPVLNLMPCPFCGSSELVIIRGDSAERCYGIRCRNCYTLSPMQKTQEAAVENWNRRLK